MSFICGAGFVWSSPFIPKLNGNVDQENNPLPHPTKPFEDSLITSLYLFGAVCSPLLVGTIANKFGKKKVLLACIIFPTLSNIIIVFANSVEQFCIARFLLGLGTGCVFSLVPIYVAEISDSETRGATSLIMTLMITLSQLLVFIFGPHISIKIFSLISLLPIMLFIICFGLFAPESSYHLILHNQKEDAKRYLKMLRGKTDVEKDILEISLAIEEMSTPISLSTIMTKKVKKCLTIALGLLFFQQFSGILPIQCYMQSIFESAGGTIPPEKSAMLAGAVSFIVTLASTKAVNVVGRKVLLLASYGGMLASLLLLGLYFYLQESAYNVNAVSWFPVVMLLSFLISFCMAAGPIPWTIIGEIFPSNLKPYLSSVAVCFCFLVSSILTLIFPLAAVVTGISTILWTFATFTAISIFFIIYCVPETKGKTLQEIQVILDERTK